MIFACDGNAAFGAARDIYRAIVRTLDADFVFRDSWFGFDDLAAPAAFEQTVVSAAAADLIFCCPSNPYSLPHSVLDWMGQWLARRQQPDGVLAMLLPVVAGHSFSHQTLLEKDLRETARVNGLTFFSTKYIVTDACGNGI